MINLSNNGGSEENAEIEEAILRLNRERALLINILDHLTYEDLKHHEDLNYYRSEILRVWKSCGNMVDNFSSQLLEDALNYRQINEENLKYQYELFNLEKQNCMLRDKLENIDPSKGGGRYDNNSESSSL